MAGIDVAAIMARGVAVTMDVLGTAKTTAILHKKGTGGTYNPETDTTTDVSVDTTVEGIKYSTKETQGTGATSWNTEFLIEGVDAPDGLNEADTVTIDGETWNIVIVKAVPTNAVMILGLRK